MGEVGGAGTNGDSGRCSTPPDLAELMSHSSVSGAKNVTLISMRP